MIASRQSSTLCRANDEAERFEIQPVYSADLRELADFIYTWRGNDGDDTRPSVERRLRWLLAENPAAEDESPVGFCVRDEVGGIRGINLCFPCPFLAGDERIMALCSGSFFVQPSARSFGFYLFKRYLACQGYAFHYATTCNRNSEPLWRMLGGNTVPGSEMEYIVPLRLDAVLPAFLTGKPSNSLRAQIARLVGRLANPVLDILPRPATSLEIEPCQDWEKLAALYYRHRSRDRIASERSAEFLQWRYGPCSPVYPGGGVYLIRDTQGNEGWIALGMLIRGEVHGRILLDAVWPRENFSFKEVFRAFVSLGRGYDALFFRRQPGFDYRDFCRWAIPHRLDARTFVIHSADTSVPLNDFDYDDNDYVAWMFQWDRHGVR